MGKFYWKLNVKLLEEDNIEVEFKNLWENLIKLKKMYSDINQWWDLCAKKSICRFFQKKGREKSRLYHGLIRYLE